MKKILLPATMVASLLALAVLPSCKKDDPAVTRAQQIVGTWLTTEDGSDVNNNGSWDQSEHNAIASADAATLKFNSDGTGTTTGMLLGTPVTANINWTLLNNDQDIRIITSFFGSADTTLQHFVSFDGSNAVLSDPSSTPTDYLALKKQ